MTATLIATAMFLINDYIFIGLAFCRYDIADTTVPVRFSTLNYLVPTPKPVQTFYQFINPFGIIVWQCLFGLFFVYVILFIIGALFRKWKKDPKEWMLESAKDKSFIDYFIYPIGIFLTPMTDKKWINEVRLGSLYGLLGLMTMVFGAFLMTSIYKNELLSHLMVTGYEKPLRNVDGMYMLASQKKYRVGHIFPPNKKLSNSTECVDTGTKIV